MTHGHASFSMQPAQDIQGKIASSYKMEQIWSIKRAYQSRITTGPPHCLIQAPQCSFILDSDFKNKVCMCCQICCNLQTIIRFWANILLWTILPALCFPGLSTGKKFQINTNDKGEALSQIVSPASWVTNLNALPDNSNGLTITI